MLVERGDPFVAIEPAERVVGEDQPSVGELREDGLVVLDVVGLPRVDEDEIPRTVELPHLLFRVADAVLDAIGDAHFLGVAAGDCSRLLLDVEREELPALRQPARDLDPRPARENADLEHAHRFHERHDEAEERSLVRADRHLRRLLRRVGLLAEPAKGVERRRRVRLRVCLNLFEVVRHVKASL